MANRRNPEVYRGRRHRLNVLGIVAGAIVVLLLLAVVLFFGLQKYIVFGSEGISVVLPGAQTGETEGTTDDGTREPLEDVEAAVTITEPDYSALAATAGEGLQDMTAVYVPSSSVSLSGVGSYLDVMSSYGANALVLDVKPVSGQLAWASSSEIATSYGTNGTTDLGALVDAIRQQDPDI